MTLVRLTYNKGKNISYFLKTRKGKYVPIIVEQGVFSEVKDIVSEEPVELNLSGFLV